MRRGLMLVATVAIVLGACGGDDDDGSSDPPAEQADDAAEEADAEEFIVPEVSDDDDITTQLLAKLFGLPAGFVPAEGRACMSAELAPLFPDGVVPDDVQLTDDLVMALDDAAETCGVTDFGG